MSTARELRGAPVARRIRTETAESVQVLARLFGIRPSLVTIQVGHHPSADAYRDAIRRAITTVGVEHRHLGLEAETTPGGLVATLQGLNAAVDVHGVIVLMPLPLHLSIDLILENLSPLKDVDGITPTNAGRLYLGLPALRPSTPQGGIELLDFYGLTPARRRVAVVGRSSVVGRPLAVLLSFRDATVTLCHRQTVDLAAITREADIVALAAGTPGLLTGAMIKPGAIVLDFGVNVVDGRVVGDADEASIASVAAAYTPVPGGTGPVTAVVLARNTVAAAYASLHGSLDECDGVAPIVGSADRGSVA